MNSPVLYTVKYLFFASTNKIFTKSHIALVYTISVLLILNLSNKSLLQLIKKKSILYIFSAKVVDKLFLLFLCHVQIFNKIVKR